MNYPFLQGQEKLYGGDGLVYTVTERCKGRIPFAKAIITMELEEGATVGRHRNDCWEIYFSPSFHIRFNHHNRWKPFMLVRPGALRSIQNIGSDEGIVYAIKF